MFSFYWKEIAIVLAGVFAILGAISDVKDKRTKRITVWGRVFFTLTVLSVIAGVYAQWAESGADEARIKQAQSDMLRLLERTEKSVYDLSRLMQPIDRPRVTVILKPDCDVSDFKPFCDAVRVLAKKKAAQFHFSQQSSFTVENVDWSTWPEGRLFGSVYIGLFKDPNAATTFLNTTAGSSGGDMSLNITVTPIQMGSQLPTASVDYNSSDETVSFVATQNSITPQINTDKIMSILDLPGSTMTIIELNKLFSQVTLTAVFIETAHGQSIQAFNLKPLTQNNKRVFSYQFPAVR